jgi:hypothetical protein
MDSCVKDEMYSSIMTSCIWGLEVFHFYIITMKYPLENTFCNNRK